ncbi:MAG: heme biosynthesis HemY N-terminal domain-containing protein [Betaproteobacteria bacterium]
MKGLLWVLVLFASAVGISLAAHFNEGYVLLVIPPYRVELTLNFMLLLLFGGFVLFYGVLRVMAMARSLPRRVREFRERRQREKTLSTFYDAVRLLFEGRFSQALKKAGEAHAAGQSPALAALLAARAAQRLRDPVQLKKWLELTVKEDVKMQAAGLMLEAEMQLEMRAFDDAAETLKRLHQTSGVHIAALRLELRAQQGRENWDEVLRLVHQLEKHHVLLPEVAREIKFKAHQENIRLRGSDRSRLLVYQKSIPVEELGSVLIYDFAVAMLALGAPDEACRHLAMQLDRSWDSSLVALYGCCREGDLAARLAHAESWLPAHRDDLQLLLTLGRLALAVCQWDKAQSYLESALVLSGQSEIHLELASLFEQTNRADDALRHYRAAAGVSL